MVEKKGTDNGRRNVISSACNSWFYKVSQNPSLPPASTFCKLWPISLRSIHEDISLRVVSYCWSESWFVRGLRDDLLSFDGLVGAKLHVFDLVLDCEQLFNLERLVDLLLTPPTRLNSRHMRTKTMRSSYMTQDSN